MTLILLVLADEARRRDFAHSAFVFFPPFFAYKLLALTILTDILVYLVGIMEKWWSRFAPASLTSPFARGLTTQLLFVVAPLKASLKDTSPGFFEISLHNRVHVGNWCRQTAGKGADQGNVCI